MKIRQWNGLTLFLVRISKMKYTFIFVLACLLLSCSMQNKQTRSLTTESHSIENSLHDIWALEEISNQKIEELGKFAKRPQLEIFVKDMKVVGNDGCNQFSGSIKELDNSHILFAPLMSTRMACPDMIVSDKFNQALVKVASYKRDGLKLLLLDKEGAERLQFQKID